MTEVEWEACDDPRARLRFLGGYGDCDSRKMRLLVCGAWRWRYTYSAPWVLRQTVFRGMTRLVGRAEDAADGGRPLASRAWGALIFSLPSPWQAAEETLNSFEAGFLRLFDTESEWQTLRRLTEEVFGNPFRPAAFDAAWRTPIVTALAKAAYEYRFLPSGELDPHRLAVLADALEEVGAADEVVAHLRSDGPHVRGCHVLDYCLGKS